MRYFSELKTSKTNRVVIFVAGTVNCSYMLLNEINIFYIYSIVIFVESCVRLTFLRKGIRLQCSIKGTANDVSGFVL